MRHLAALLPGIPRFSETRGMLLEGRCELLGVDEGPSFVARGLYPEEKLVSVVGHPGREAVAEAVARNEGSGVVVAMPENADSVARALPGWGTRAAVLHALGEGGLTSVPWGRSGCYAWKRGLAPTSRTPRRAGGRPAQGHAPGGHVRREDAGLVLLRCGGDRGAVDVSIDTLEGYRRRGYAAACAAFMGREYYSKENTR